MPPRAIALVAALALVAPSSASAARVETRMPSDVHETLQRHDRQLRRCFDRGLRNTMVTRGKLVVKFRVSAAGRVRKVAFDRRRSTVRHARVERCVSSVFRSIRFPRQGETTWFTSPLVFGSV